jgi:hypothetical protein
MAFTVDDFHDLIALLEREPGWRDNLRRLLLTEELLRLPEIVRGLAEAQQRTETRMESLESAVESLAEAQQRTETRLGELAKAQERTEIRLGELVDAVLEMKVDIGSLKGSDLERRHQERAPAYLGGIIRSCHALTSDERVAMLEDAIERSDVSDEEANAVMLTDVIARGRMREDRREVYLVVEVSWGVGVHDVERAIERARILSKTGVEALPVVAGEWVTPDAQQYLSAAHVWQVRAGRATPPAA